MPRRQEHPRCLVYADLTAREYATVKRLADRDKLTIANFVRRAINSVLLEEGLDEELIEEQEQGRHAARRSHLRSHGKGANA